VVGLSNVSFGLPERRWINAAFLAMASASGLTAAIANPASEELMFVKKASDVLGGRDRDAAGWIALCAKSGGAATRAPAGALPPEQRLREAVLEGNREAVGGLVAESLKAGVDAAALAQEVMIPAIVEVGERFGRKEYFLPQLIASGETMKIGMEALEPFLKQASKEATGRGTILIATVKGDIHDIGKNIVALMLRNHGYRVVDLGKDVASERIVREIEKHRPHVVGLSALMTTTMTRMKEVIDLARRRGLSCPFLVGGAVVTRAYADSIGAAYARDGVEAVQVIEAITGVRRKA
jgi:5-methyltetrahydrofolate--homocysteine methyltransferase